MVKGRDCHCLAPDPVVKMHIFMAWQARNCYAGPVERDLILSFATSKYQSTRALQSSVISQSIAIRSTLVYIKLGRVLVLQRLDTSHIPYFH